MGSGEKDECRTIPAAVQGREAFRSAIDTKLSYTMRTRYTMWLAEWGTKPSYDGDFDIWQKSDSGSINGISGDVDLDVCYRDDFPSVIKAKRLNGFGITPAEQVHKTIYKSDISDYMQKVEKCLVDVDKAVASTISAMEELREAFEND